MSFVVVVSLSRVVATDWTMLRALARRVLCGSGPLPVRHPSQDLPWDIERSAVRLSGYIDSGELRIDIVVTTPRTTVAGLATSDASAGADHHADADAPVGEDATADAPGVHVEVHLTFDDGLEPIVVPWGELDFLVEPAPHLR